MRVLIIGSGRLGRSIADRLLAKDEQRMVFRSHEHQITFIEVREDRCLELEARYNVPIYQGGRVSAIVRQNKEILGQRRIEVDESVDNVRAATVSAYSQLNAAVANTTAGEAQLRAARLALEGSVEERRVGQRTTLDVLRAQQDVIDAQLLLTGSRRDSIVAGYPGRMPAPPALPDSASTERLLRLALEEDLG